MSRRGRNSHHQSEDWRGEEGENGDQPGANPAGPSSPQLDNERSTNFGPEAEVVDDQRPAIRLVEGDLTGVVDEAESALIAAGCPIYARAGRLVMPVTEKVAAAKGRETTIVSLAEVRRETLVDQLSKVARFQRSRRTDTGVQWAPADPPNRIADVLRHRVGLWKFSRVAGVINAPTLRYDGSLLVKPGYDQTTRLFLALDEDLKLPSLSQRPTRGDAKAALDVLKGLIKEFPFVDGGSHAAALSGMLTPIVRASLTVALMHLVRASTPATGKSYFVDICAAIALGKRCPVITAGHSPDETDKRLGSLILSGAQIVSIDNLDHDIGGATLCQAVERPNVQVRILGRSEMPECESRATIFATGNNVTVVDDMVRRTVLIQMATELERPELRKFGLQPFEMILSDRGRYIAAALTVIRAYISAGSPVVCDQLASFGDWSRMVRSPLIWLGENDPVITMEKLKGQDPFVQNIFEFFGEIERHRGQVCDGNGLFTAIKIIEAVENGFGTSAMSELHSLLLRIAGAGSRISPVRLGKWLSSIADRVIDGRRLRKWEDTKASNRYWIETIRVATS